MRAGTALGSASPVVNAMTCDVEDYFQVQAFFDHIDRKDWPRHEPRVERNTDRVLALFEEAGVKATFFTLGWVAERHPQVVRRIVAQGHELASHGMAHYRADAQTPDEFRSDISRTKVLLEDFGSTPVRGYRAASFSIGARNLWAFDVLAECGYAYSSSVYPVKHDIYGMPEAPRAPFRPRGANGVLEVPISTVSLLGRNLPCGGGGFFRLLPYAYSRWAIGHVNRAEGRPTVFYFHPWEVDPEQPMTPGIGLKTRVRHYTNLRRMVPRLARVLRGFSWGRMDEVFLAPAEAERRAA
jgi:polysaccharide deacetylase family protein (PEP-CTERM system associated)